MTPNRRFPNSAKLLGSFGSGVSHAVSGRRAVELADLGPLSQRASRRGQMKEWGELLF